MRNDPPSLMEKMQTLPLGGVCPWPRWWSPQLGTQHISFATTDQDTTEEPGLCSFLYESNSHVVSHSTHAAEVCVLDTGSARCIQVNNKGYHLVSIAGSQAMF